MILVDEGIKQRNTWATPRWDCPFIQTFQLGNYFLAAQLGKVVLVWLDFSRSPKMVLPVEVLGLKPKFCHQRLRKQKSSSELFFVKLRDFE